MDPKNRKPPAPAPATTTVAFAVIQKGKMYHPTRIEIDGGVVRNEVPCGPIGPYQVIAHQYLSAAVSNYYHSLAIAEAARVAR